MTVTRLLYAASLMVNGWLVGQTSLRQALGQPRLRPPSASSGSDVETSARRREGGSALTEDAAATKIQSRVRGKQARRTHGEGGGSLGFLLSILGFLFGFFTLKILGFFKHLQ